MVHLLQLFSVYFYSNREIFLSRQPTYTHRQVFQSCSDIALFSQAEIIRIRAYHPRGVFSDSHKSRVRHNRFQS